MLQHPVTPLLGQLPSGYAGAGGEGVPPHLEEDLIRLVLAEQLEGVAITIQKEDRCGATVPSSQVKSTILRNSSQCPSMVSEAYA